MPCNLQQKGLTHFEWITGNDLAPCLQVVCVVPAAAHLGFLAGNIVGEEVAHLVVAETASVERPVRDVEGSGQ